MSLLLESINDLIEEVKVYHQGKAKTLDGKLKRQLVGKAAGKKWNGTRYVNQTGTEKAMHRKAAIKRGRTMKTGAGARAQRSKVGARERTKVKRSAGIR
jgi:hypothetical protein